MVGKSRLTTNAGDTILHRVKDESAITSPEQYHSGIESALLTVPVSAMSFAIIDGELAGEK
jgi:hypothetical protein